jgi:hypothetical protein
MRASPLIPASTINAQINPALPTGFIAASPNTYG